MPLFSLVGAFITEVGVLRGAVREKLYLALLHKKELFTPLFPRKKLKIFKSLAIVVRRFF